MNQYRKWSVILLFLALLVMIWDVLTVPDYREGESFVSYSPDGKYRLDLIFPPDNGRSVRVLTSLGDGKVKAIIPTSAWFDDVGINPTFICTDDESNCYKHMLQTDRGILNLPPLPWTRLHAWLVINLNQLEEPNLKIMKISKRYPPVTKESQ